MYQVLNILCWQKIIESCEANNLCPLWAYMYRYKYPWKTCFLKLTIPSNKGRAKISSVFTKTTLIIICFHSNQPYSKSNITFQLLAPEPVARPGYNDFFNTPELLEFVLATQVRIRMQGHYHVSNTRHQYYGIEEVTVNTRFVTTFTWPLQNSMEWETEGKLCDEIGN